MKTAIINGRVVTASETFDADVLIDGEKIVAIGTDLAGEADTVIDAAGKLLLPGGIDVHTHLDMPFGGTVSCDDFTTGHIAALHGGTTTHIDFSTQTRGESLQQGLDRWHAKANGKAVADYGFHMIITDAREDVIDEMDSLIEQGVTSFKLFLAYPDVLMVDDDTLYAVMEKASSNGGLVLIHAENGQVIDRLVKAAVAAGQNEPKYHAATRPAVLEGEATSRAITLANLAGAPLYVVHVTCEPAVRAIADARRNGQRVWGETCTQYFYLTEDNLAEPNFGGAKYVCSPPLRTKRDQEVLWDAVAKNDLQVVSTDHCPFNFAEQKRLGKDSFAAIPNGIPGIEERMSLLSQGVHDGHISWNRLVELSSTNPAKLFGLYGRKGAIAVGFDADIVLWDADSSKTWSDDNIHSAIDYTCYAGTTTQGLAHTVLRRGEVVIEGGEFIGQPGTGQFQKRDAFTYQHPHDNGAPVTQSLTTA